MRSCARIPIKYGPQSLMPALTRNLMIRSPLRGVGVERPLTIWKLSAGAIVTFFVITAGGGGGNGMVVVQGNTRPYSLLSNGPATYQAGTHRSRRWMKQMGREPMFLGTSLR